VIANAMKLSVIQRSAIGLSFALLLALLVGVWLHHTIQLSMESEQWLDHTNEVLSTMSNLAARLNDAVTASRDYVATGSERDRQSIEHSCNDAETFLRQLHGLVVDNPRHQKRLAEVDPLVKRLIGAAKSIVPASAHTLPEASGDSLTPIRDAIRRQLRDMHNEEQTLMRDRLEEQREATRTTMAFALSGSGLTLFLLSVSGYLMIREVRERTKTERILMDKTQLLAAANKELESFSYSVSHDLRAPLRSMSGFAKILEEDFGPQLENGGVRYLGLIQKNAERMGCLIDDLLAFSRLNRQPLTRSIVSPAALARDTFDSLETERNGRQIELVVGELPPCQADYSLLRQVFVNLLSNAVKFTRNRTPTRIEVGSQGEQDKTVYFVRDNGVGFDMQYVDKLFNVFQRLHRVEDYEGTGVGLAIVQRIVARHGGRIWAESAVDQGTTFYFTLSGEASSG
jgi:signal transduction histidine kinase